MPRGTYPYYPGSFNHLHHKCAQSFDDVITGSYSAKDGVYHADCGQATGYKSADMGHQDSGSHRANVSTLSTHVWSSDDKHVAFLWNKIFVLNLIYNLSL